MSAQTLKIIESPVASIQLVTFVVGDIVLGIDIARVQEINRHLDVTRVPGASPMIHGVVNLRGDVVTVIDPHRVFGLDPSIAPACRRSLILNIGGERIGILVDDISDILTVKVNDLVRRPSNVRSLDRQFIESVYLQSEQIVVMLNTDQLLKVIEQSSTGNSAVA